MSIVINGKSLDIVQMEKGWQHGLDDKTLQSLRALPLEQQIAKFRLAKTTSYQQYSYGEQDFEQCYGRTISVSQCSEVLGVIVQDNTAVGLYVREWYHYDRPLFVGQCCCIYSACDEDGTGRSERNDYIVLHLEK